MKTSDYKSFAYLESGDIVFSEFETIKSSNKLDSGSYKVNYLGYPENKVTIKQDSDFEIGDIVPYRQNHKLLLNTGWELKDSFYNRKSTNIVGLFSKKINKKGICK